MAEDSTRVAAEQKKDENILFKIRGVDLVAGEAHYHSSCKYIHSLIRWAWAVGSELGSATIRSRTQCCILTMFVHMSMST